MPRIIPMHAVTAGTERHGARVLQRPTPEETTTMDLHFTPAEEAFRQEIRQWVAENLPKDISHKVHNALRLDKSDLQRWARILGAKGWHGWGWPKQAGWLR